MRSDSERYKDSKRREGERATMVKGATHVLLCGSSTYWPMRRLM